MKDVISILQSRIAKRENIITQIIRSECYTTSFSGIVEDQKQDKRILAEIVRLRREVKQQRRAKALRDVLYKGIQRQTEVSEQEVLEMENKILAARWGE